MEKIEKPVDLDTKLKSYAGIVETGLFCNVVDTVIAGVGNKVEVINKKRENKPY
jgi:ribose 5-phosphate isomerase